MLPLNEIHLWQISLDSTRYDLSFLSKHLNDEEKTRMRRFQFQSDQEQFSISHAALQIILKDYLENNDSQIFLQGEHGKPSLKDVPICFNLSHSHDWALIAVAQNCEVGIDIEKVNEEKDVSNISRRFFSEREANFILSLPPSEQVPAFYKAWTRKEALAKAKGVALASDIGNEEVDARWSVEEIEISGYAAAIAFEGKKKIVLKNWKDFLKKKG